MGHRITRAASHLSVEEVKERMNTDARPWVRQHWWIIYNALVAPRKAEEIALHTGVSATTVHRVIATYNRLGPTAMETPGKGGRRHEYLTLPEEQAFLAPFFAQAARGEIAAPNPRRGSRTRRSGPCATAAARIPGPSRMWTHHRSSSR